MRMNVATARTLLVVAMAALASSCSSEPSPKQAPFGVPWGSDTAAAERHMLERGLRRDARVDLSDRSLGIIHASYLGGPFLGVASSGSDLVPDGDVSYSLIFDRGRMRSATAIVAFGDSTARAAALETITRRLDEMWSGTWTAAPSDASATGEGARIWPVEDSVSAGVSFETVTAPRTSYVVSIGFDRVAIPGDTSRPEDTTAS